jgi:hypothetical protein
MAAAKWWIKWNKLQSTVPKPSLALHGPMCNRIPAVRPTLQFFTLV